MPFPSEVKYKQPHPGLEFGLFCPFPTFITTVCHKSSSDGEALVLEI